MESTRRRRDDGGQLLVVYAEWLLSDFFLRGVLLGELIHIHGGRILRCEAGKGITVENSSDGGDTAAQSAL